MPPYPKCRRMHTVRDKQRLLGRVKMTDGLEYERRIRAEWDEREPR